MGEVYYWLGEDIVVVYEGGRYGWLEFYVWNLIECIYEVD